MTAVAIQHKDQILESIAAGARLTDIAKSLGYKDHSAIVHRLKDDPRYIIAREVGAEARIESRERELELASESVTVARADRLLGHARWRCEREFPHRWGAKQQVDVNVSIRVEERLVDDLQALICGECTTVEEESEHTGVMSNASDPDPLLTCNTEPAQTGDHEALAPTPE